MSFAYLRQTTPEQLFFVDIIVFTGSSTKAALAAAPTTGTPPGIYRTADGSIEEVPSTWIEVGFPSMTAATTLLVVPKSIPTAFMCSSFRSVLRLCLM